LSRFPERENLLKMQRYAWRFRLPLASDIFALLSGAPQGLMVLPDFSLSKNQAKSKIISAASVGSSD